MYGFFPHVQQFSDTYNLAQFVYCLPRGSSKYHRPRTRFHKTSPSPIQVSITNPRLSPVLLTYLLWLEGSRTPSLSSGTLLEGLTEPRETLYLPGHQFIIKLYNAGGRWKRHTGQGMGKGLGASMSSPQISKCSSAWGLPERCLSFYGDLITYD